MKSPEETATGARANRCVPSLYKFLPEQYVDALLNGTVLFRNLVYFRSIEGDPRRDDYEGAHVDAPDHDVEITNVTTGLKLSGRFAYHNTSNHLDRIYCFCLSLSSSASLQKFGSACVEFNNPTEFERRLRVAIARKARVRRFEKPLLIGKPVRYYKVTEAAPLGVNIKDCRNISFLKRAAFEEEREFRFACARRGGYELKQMITNKLYSPSEDLVGLDPMEMVVDIGSIRDIARLIHRP